MPVVAKKMEKQEKMKAPRKSHTGSYNYSVYSVNSVWILLISRIVFNTTMTALSYLFVAFKTL